MKILHLYPPTNAMIAQYAHMVSRGMPGNVETAMSNDVRNASQLVGDMHPDIVHLHGCHDNRLLGVARKACRHGARMVLSPHGEMFSGQADLLPAHKSYAEQAYVLIAQSQMEAQVLSRLTNRLEVISNPIITRTTTPDELAEKTMAVYRKVLASDVLELMQSGTRTAMRQLLKAAITADRRWLANEGDSNGLLAATTLSEAEWQKLYVYAEYEGISELLKRGIVVLGIQAPHCTLSPIFLPDNYAKPIPLNVTDPMQIVGKAREETASHTLSLLRLAELDQALREPDLDEEVLMQELQSAQLTRFFAALLQTMQEQTGLDPGFMPCPPQENRDTKQIRTAITKHLKI